jgi:hypothetical protein
MYLGTATWNDVCAPEIDLPSLVREMCTLLSQYTLQLPVAAAIGSTSLVWYNFLPGYACYDELPDNQEQTQILSGRASPNKILTCPSVTHGTPQHSDLYTCTIVCDAGFTLQNGACVSVCAGLQVSYTSGYFATAECLQGPVTLYNCSVCVSQPGFGQRAAQQGINDAFSCHYTTCPPGTRSTGLACEACPVNSFSNTSQALACTSCDTILTGTYQSATGKTSCGGCMWNTSAEAHTCPPGSSIVHDFECLQQLFRLYAHDHNANIEDYIPDICDRGYACLPCEPGHYESDRSCIQCPHGSYQQNFGAQAVASTHSSECVCVEGFE